MIALRPLHVLWLLLVLAACSAQPVQLPHLGPDDVVLAFGDSITYGTGAGPEQSYPNVLAQLIHRRVINAGVPGETTADGMARLPSVLEEVRPKLMLLCIGGNDMLRKLDRLTVESNLRAMVQLARERGVDVVLIGVPEPVMFGDTAPVYGNVAKDYHLAFEDRILREVLFDKRLKSDEIHPNASGYRRLAQAIADLLHGTGAI
ncbi:MAG TPA: arylesterase [Burkholderiales bacterium]|nr:arylesterase [Burkholderiales bacterium]